MPTPLFSNLANVINSVFGNRPAGEDTVIDVKHTVYAIGWLALNQSVSLGLLSRAFRSHSLASSTLW